MKNFVFGFLLAAITLSTLSYSRPFGPPDAKVTTNGVEFKRNISMREYMEASIELSQQLAVSVERINDEVIILGGAVRSMAAIHEASTSDDTTRDALNAVGSQVDKVTNKLNALADKLDLDATVTDVDYRGSIDTI